MKVNDICLLSTRVDHLLENRCTKLLEMKQRNINLKLGKPLAAQTVIDEVLNLAKNFDITKAKKRKRD